MAAVKDMAELVTETVALMPELAGRFKLEGVAKFAANAGFTDPFAEGPLSSLRVEKRITRAVNVEGSPVEDDDGPPMEE